MMLNTNSNTNNHTKVNCNTPKAMLVEGCTIVRNNRKTERVRESGEGLISSNFGKFYTKIIFNTIQFIV